ncbi:hypothetical protein CS022_23335 [Veronia nyctiphanis]|uniref:Arabinan endo-1,5-alpha-L-arabinosidase n=1 Tax=Veronia nyctiphanis TaxID=1278244 RepID=A0A4Q0YMK1_9GAMM|nr:arabinan endo-1,5-alpha-L-arabinosidase [Veronia nyctiphanis]RXJ70411.1 hypothetical protein CS022_23335 [Veronia nyctiphanis]
MRENKKLNISLLISSLFIIGCDDECIETNENIVRTMSIEGNESEPHVGLIHDPSITKLGNDYYIYSSSPLASFYTSTNLRDWKYKGNVFDDIPQWLKDKIPESDHIGSPDIHFYNDEYVLMYQSHKSGTCIAATGFATNKTLDPNDPNYKWIDKGEILRSAPLVPGVVEFFCGDQGKFFNAIDATLFIDNDGKPWMAFGSSVGFPGLNPDLTSPVHLGGVFLLELNPETLKPVNLANMITLASRSVDDLVEGNYVVEGAYIQYREGYYYLYISHNRCCEGANTKYKVMVGRSTSVTGPYVDQKGKTLISGGGTLVVDRDRSTNMIGTGHNDVYSEDGKDWLVHHGYDGQDDYKPKLNIREIKWDNGWPRVCPVRASDLGWL